MTDIGHGWKNIDESAGLHCYEYGNQNGKANTTVVKLTDEQLLVISPASTISKAEMDALAGFGDVVVLLAPNHFHHMGIKKWKKRWPEAKCFASQKALPRLSKKYPDYFESLEALRALLPKHIQLLEPSQPKQGEVLVRIQTDAGWIWCLTDVVINIKKMPSHFFLRIVMRILGFLPGLRINRFFATVFLKEKQHFKAWLLNEMEECPPHIVVLGHGAPITGTDAQEQLLQAIKVGL